MITVYHSYSCSLSLVQITHLGSNLSLMLIMIIVPVTKSPEITINVLNANKMTDIVNDVIICSYTITYVYANT